MAPQYVQDQAGQELLATKQDAGVNEGQKGAAAGQKSADLTPDKESLLYDQYVAMAKSMGNGLDESVGNVNVIGIRGWLDGQVVENVKNKYNDTIVCIWVAEENGAKVKHCVEFIASVDPGKNKNPTPKGGKANLIDGQYTYRAGTHNGKSYSYSAFRSDEQNGTSGTRVWRDKNNDGVRNDQTDKVDASINHTINIHGGGYYTDNVGANSDGCQVIAKTGRYDKEVKAMGKSTFVANGKGKAAGKKYYNGDFVYFREIIKQNDKDQKFVYTLLNGSDAQSAVEKTTVADRRRWSAESVGEETDGLIDVPAARIPAPLSVPASTPEKLEVPKQTFHVIQRGETLRGIAKKYGVTVSALKKANGIRGSVIHAGRQLVIPKA